MERILLLAITVLLLSCDKQNNKEDCRQAICTEIFAMVNIAVQDVNNKPLILSEHYTVNVQTNDTLRFNNGNAWPEGNYTVADDSYTSKMHNKRYDFRFIGISNNKVVVNEVYTISADCCHINKVSGEDTVVVK